MDQTEVVEFLSDPSTHGGEAPVEVITTHSAHVFLVGDVAYKIKRAVKYNYLDFTAPSVRRDIIRHEHALNAPAAPQIYDCVVAITREPSGDLALEGSGDPVEYALRMHRFPREDELSSIADTGDLTTRIAEQLGSATGGYHMAAKVRSDDGAILVREIIDELKEAFSDMGAALGQDRLSVYFERTEKVYGALSSLLTDRTAQGFVRRCHGDLHLKNIVMIDGAPVPFDALEFDERLGTCDVLYDMAFLIMDLWHRDLRQQANVVLGSYLRATGDFAGLAALPLFLSIRAAIRSMVAVQTMSGDVSDEVARDARDYLDQATEYLNAAPSRLVAIGGVSGTGKTTIAARVAPSLGPAPGAVHLRSDLDRKALFGVDPLERLPEAAYRPGVSDQVYQRVLAQAEKILTARHSVIIDATFLSDTQSRAARALAERLKIPFDGIWLGADPDVLERRVAARTGDASDADVEVLRAQLESQNTPESWQDVDASGDPETVALLVEAYLFTV